MIGSLFSGIGGLELGLERAGLGRVAWQVERSPYCRHVLSKHWPDVPQYDDVRTVGRHNLTPVSVLCGGFPCQDLSTAGKGAGLAGDRSGLWFEMQRIIDELRPTWVVVENISHGWRRYLPVVRRALWELGYASLPLRVRACDVGARHERARVFIVAGAPADVDRVAVRVQRWGLESGWTEAAESGADATDVACGRRSEAAERAGKGIDREGRWTPNRGCTPADHASIGLPIGLDVEGDGRQELSAAGGGADDGAGLVSPGFGLPPRPWMVRVVHGLPSWVDGASRSGWTAARVREARVHGLGNAVVPQAAEAVGRLIVGAMGAV